MKPIIGILGGMGPRVTVDFEGRLLRLLPGTDQDMPTIITINDGSIPDRSSYLLGRGDDPVPQLVRNGLLLENMGASFLCMPCNSACAPAILKRVQTGLKVEVLNLPQLVGEKLEEFFSRNVLILATEGTIKTGTFQEMCRAKGMQALVPNQLAQSFITRTIACVKENRLSEARTTAAKARSLLESCGADTVILGCTELPSVARQLVPRNTAVIIDTLEVLAQAAVSYTTSNKREKIDNATR